MTNRIRRDTPMISHLVGLRLLTPLCLLAMFTHLSPAGSDINPVRVFDVAGQPAQHAVVSAPFASLAIDSLSGVPDTPMLREIAGVIGTLTSRQLGRFRRAVVPRTRVPDDVIINQHLATLHLFNHDDEALVEIALVEHGWILARSLDRPVAARLDGRAVNEIIAAWPTPRPPLPDQPFEPGGVIDLPKPYTPSPIRLDEKTVSDRFARGGTPLFPEPLSRDLAGELFHARRPVGHRLDRPAGLLVWISPAENGEIPGALFQIADTLGLICISPAGAGNERLAVDRFQLALDAVSTASSRWWIDRTRVYAAGMSGGGRIASMLWSCFPDVFTGGVGVVGMNSHQKVGVGDGRYWPKTHKRPAGDLGRLIAGHRFAAVTGPRDFNFHEIKGRARLLRREGLDVRVFDFENHLHAMSTPDQFGEALTWADQPWAVHHAEQTDRAKKLLDLYTARYGDAPPADEKAAHLLERVTSVGPWTEPAWRAAEFLGYTIATPTPAEAAP